MNIQNWQQCIQEGDIIFSSIPHFLYKTIEKNTRSPTSHVGIIFKQNGQWVVAESKVPFSKVSPLEDFINRSDKGWISVKRLKTGLSQRQIEQMKKVSYQLMGKPYDLGFNYHSKKLFCSKFVYDVFAQACGLTIGELETYSALIAKSPNGITLFWRLWFCGFIPFNTTSITPHSQWVDPQLEEVACHV